MHASNTQAAKHVYRRFLIFPPKMHFGVFLQIFTDVYVLFPENVISNQCKNYVYSKYVALTNACRSGICQTKWRV